VLTGTVLSGSRIPVDTLLAVLVHWAVEGRPRPVEVARQRSITAEAARLLVRRIDAALERAGCGDPLRAVLGGPPGRALAARAVTPSRASRPGRTGPSADYGDG
jgi:hypothetical protein